MKLNEGKLYKEFEEYQRRYEEIDDNGFINDNDTYDFVSDLQDWWQNVNKSDPEYEKVSKFVSYITTPFGDKVIDIDLDELGEDIDGDVDESFKKNKLVTESLDEFINESRYSKSEAEPEDDLKANFRSWETEENTREDAEQLFYILQQRHPRYSAKKLRQLAYDWCDVDPNQEDEDELINNSDEDDISQYTNESIINEKEFSKTKRKTLAKKGSALPDGSYPIENTKDLKNAIHASGRAKDKERAKSHIKSRARSLGKVELIPDKWKK